MALWQITAPLAVSDLVKIQDAAMFLPRSGPQGHKSRQRLQSTLYPHLLLATANGYLSWDVSIQPCACVIKSPLFPAKQELPAWNM